MFWGLLLKASKRYSQVVQKGFHISHATLDVASGDSGEEVTQVWVQADDANHLLCNLDKQTSHVTLDLAFSEGETIAFFSKGAGIVHLTGYLIPEDPEFDGFGMGEEEIEDEEVSDEEISTSKKVKKGKSKASAHEELEDEEDDDSELDENELLSDDDEIDEEEGEEEEDEEDDDDEEVTSPPSKIAKVDKSAKQQNGLSNGKAAPKVELKQKKQKEKKEKQPQNANQSQPGSNQSQTNANQSQQKAKAGPRQIAAGVTVEDLRPGKGAEAKAGRKVSVYYEGRLKSNNKVFDSTKAGDGFKFNLGRGEVIKGWDIGVAGMKIGGKRRITCPPTAAYGPKGMPPAIPANSTLVFDVELRGVN